MSSLTGCPLLKFHLKLTSSYTERNKREMTSHSLEVERVIFLHLNYFRVFVSASHCCKVCYEYDENFVNQRLHTVRLWMLWTYRLHCARIHKVSVLYLPVCLLSYWKNAMVTNLPHQSPTPTYEPSNRFPRNLPWKLYHLRTLQGHTL
jgi:hypothetical protein